MRRFESPPLFIGVAYSMQEVEQVPTDEHDHPLDGILTELGVSMF
jgi:5-formyltetrahydrofolate cyclo-ligase